MSEVSTDALVQVQNLQKSFVKDGRRIDVLRGVNLEIGRGDAVSIMGRSGAGKSTLLQILGTLDRPSSGRVLFDGDDVFSWRESRLAAYRGRSIGFVFQFHHLLPEFDTIENAAMPAIIARMPRSEAFDRAEALLRRVGLGDRLRHRPGELSGGEQQRVALARALVMEPRLLLADEPTGNLDATIGNQIFSLLGELNRELQVTVVVVTHNPSLALALRRRLVVTDGVVADMSEAAVEELRGLQAEQS